MGKEWHELPTPLALAKLAKMRGELREHNLHDTYAAGGEKPRHPVAGELPAFRTYDGSAYDPLDEDMGRAGTRFDRNTPIELTWPEPMPRLMEPSPRTVANELLLRETFQPATTLNMLAAAWIQFENHDWFSHGDNEEDEPFEIELADDDPWSDRPMRVRRSRQDPMVHTNPDKPPTFVNTRTHWWDGSQIYGSSEERCRELRTGEDGKMIVVDGRLPADPLVAGVDLTGFSDNYWVGLALMHTLFVKEHNAICDYLRAFHPTWGDERLFHTARLVNAALMAKIHTVEWTPGILAHPALKIAMNANWYGLLGKWARQRFGRIGKGEAISGILGSPPLHHAAQFSITEEFVCCYRLHPLLRDEYEIRSHRTGELIETTDLTPIQGHGTRSWLEKYEMSDWLYSFGVSHPGAITLHNHPNALRDLLRVSGERVDVGTLDILRDRERGIPRYNGFRDMLHKPPVTSFDELCANPTWAAQIRDVYEGDIDRVDTMIGMFAETPPKGFGFSDTAFRIFVLMASRRLKSDRFFTRDYTPEVYTSEGLDWVNRNGMLDVLRRHHPELAPALAGVTNPFAPWRGRR